MGKTGYGGPWLTPMSAECTHAVQEHLARAINLRLNDSDVGKLKLVESGGYLNICDAGSGF